MPSDFRNDPESPPFRFDMKWMKVDRTGGRKGKTDRNSERDFGGLKGRTRNTESLKKKQLFINKQLIFVS